MRRQTLAFLFAALPLAVALSVSAQAPEPAAGGLDLAALNRSVDACADFYVFFNFAGRTDVADATRQTASIVPAGLSLPNRDY